MTSENIIETEQISFFEIFFKKIGFFGLFSGGPGILKITQKLPKIIKNRKKMKFWVFFFDQLRVYFVFF